MHYRVAFLCILLSALSFTSCIRKLDTITSGELGSFNDTLSVQYQSNLNKIKYFIPSPHQISLLIKDDCQYFDESLFETPVNVNLYLTTERKALVLGALGADVVYLGLYDQKELALQYLDNIRALVQVSKEDQLSASSMFERIRNNMENSDSMINAITELYRKETDAIKLADRPYLETLTIAGGWIESFYLLSNLYNKTRNSNLFGILLQQQYVIDNLIHLLSPLYEKSKDYTELIDKLVEIAYEYEVVDVNYKNMPPINTDSATFIRCKFTPLLTGSHLEKIIELSKSLRTSLIY